MVWETYTTEQQEVLYAEETELELKSIDIGVADYHRLRSKYLKKGQRSLLSTGQSVLVESVTAIIPAIEALQETARKHGAMKGITKWGVPILSLPADKIALIGLATAVNCADTTPFARSCMEIAKGLRTERRLALLKKDHPDVVKEFTHYVKNWTRQSVTKACRKAQLVDNSWDVMVRGWVGYKVLEAIITHTRIFEVKATYVAGKHINMLCFTEEARDKSRRLEDCHELTRPFYLPMLVPPRDWSTPTDGGYLIHRELFIKRGQRHLKAYAETKMPVVYKAANLQQRTPYRVNKFVLAHLNRAWADGGRVAHLPPKGKPVIPDRPQDFEYNDEAKAKWTAEARMMHDENARLASKKKSIARKLLIAKGLAKRDGFWFPFNNDWRCRGYPLPAQLHPQADDTGEALLEFGRGMPLGKEGFYWLSIHIANSLGFDKASFDERFDWVNKQNLSELVHSVQDPLNNQGWCELCGENDNPWMALAALKEWSEARTCSNQSQFISHIPVGQDGTANGLQHIAALMRDPIGGAAVNLLPGDVPSDVYGLVSMVVIARVEREAMRGCVEARNWLGKITRSTVKRAVMTTPYGVTKRGMYDQFFTDGHLKGVDGAPGANARYLRDVVYDSVGEVVVSARLHMDWLQGVARHASKHGFHLRWHGPTNFLVIQEYLETKRVEIRTTMQKIYLRDQYKEPRLNSDKQFNGIAPNHTHNLDGSHMNLTVVAANEEHGIQDFRLKHDDFASHACFVPIMRVVTREQFIIMHLEDIMGKFKAEVEEQTGLTFDPLPKRGTLDITQVAHSPYFFH